MSKTIVVTGGSRGIGRAVALGAGALGWSVGVGYRDDRSAADEVVAAIEAYGGRAVARRGDVALEEDVVAVRRDRRRVRPARRGRRQRRHHRAAVPLVETDIARIRRIVDVNVMGALLCAREAARRLAVSRGGTGSSIVLVSSAASRLGSPHEYFDYAASKGAVDSLALGSRASSPPTACASTPYARASSRRTSTRAPGSPTVPSSSPR